MELHYTFIPIYLSIQNLLRRRRPSNIRLSCERACPVSPLEPVVRWRQSTFSIIFFAIASK